MTYKLFRLPSAGQYRMRVTTLAQPWATAEPGGENKLGAHGWMEVRTRKISPNPQIPTQPKSQNLDPGPSNSRPPKTEPNTRARGGEQAWRSRLDGGNPEI